jgi:hypothetical protein
VRRKTWTLLRHTPRTVSYNAVLQSYPAPYCVMPNYMSILHLPNSDTGRDLVTVDAVLMHGGSNLWNVNASEPGVGTARDSTR